METAQIEESMNAKNHSHSREFKFRWRKYWLDLYKKKRASLLFLAFSTTISKSTKIDKRKQSYSITANRFFFFFSFCLPLLPSCLTHSTASVILLLFLFSAAFSTTSQCVFSVFCKHIHFILDSSLKNNSPWIVSPPWRSIFCFAQLSRTVERWRAWNRERRHSYRP